MKKNRIFGALSAAALLFAGACSNDVVDPNKNQGQLTPGNGSGVYMSIDFQLPTGRYDGTRSQTVDGGGSSDGTELGSPQENFVSNALIVIAASKPVPGRIEEYGFIVAGEVPGNRIATWSVTEGSRTYKATASLQKENLNELYQIYGDGNVPDVYVFVFCNPTADLLNLFDGSATKFGQSSWINATCEVLQSKDATVDKNVGIWGANSFLMNNVKLTTRELPKKLLDWEKFSTVDNPFHLSDDNPDCNVNNGTETRGVVKVERSVARFDFKDGSGTEKNLYTVLYNIGENGDVLNGKDSEKVAEPIVDIQIQKMCLVNMCNKFYYLPRVSENGQIDGKDYALCGAEKPWVRGADGKYTGGNYIVGPYASVFGGSALTGGFSNYFNFPFFEDSGKFNNEAMSSSRWDVVKVADILGSENTDNYNNKHDYHIWRYVTENVIPDNEDNQMNGISTGVVFKGKLLGNAAENIATYYEDYWDKGSIQNLINCLNGKPFTYTSDPSNTDPEASKHSGLTGKSDQDPILYYYGGKLYMGWRHIRQAAIQASVTINANGEMEINRSNSLFKAVFGDNAPIPTYTTGDKVVHNMVYVKADGSKVEIKDPLWETAKNETFGEAYQAYLSSANYAWSEWALGGKEIGSDTSGSNTPESLAKMRAAVTGAGITIYQSSIDYNSDGSVGDGPGYYCYYYYWNRHADNGLNGSMGPMEFDVVRNNVYKLSIDKISRLGHPRIPENDPNNPKPEDPDESDEIYIDVHVEIAPWAVRLNSIEF